MFAIRTPPWEAIFFTQTGQRSGELTANSDQFDAQESLGAEVCVSSGFRPPLKAPLIVCVKNIASHGGCFLVV